MKTPMAENKWRRVEEIFYTVIASERERWADILTWECGDDLDVREEIESLLEFDKEAVSDNFLGEPLNIRYEKPAETVSLIGRVFDEKYQINKQLGQGGSASVYLATHIGTKRQVAIKVIIHKHLFDTTEDVIERFRKEAQFAGSLRHPNIVNVTDFGFVQIDAQQISYLVMEYLEGYTLGKLIKEKSSLPLELIVDITEQICLALSEAHNKGIIHRDLKPENIWLEPNRRGGYNVKVLDFGLATLLDMATSDNGENKIPYENKIIPFPSYNQNMPIAFRSGKSPIGEVLFCEKNTVRIKVAPITNNGTVVGTPLYMSPEQCRGEKLGIASDIYSLGIIVYEMIAGEPPFSGNAHLLLKKHVESSPPSLKEKHQHLPNNLVELITTALSKKHTERPASAISFAITLRLAVEREIPLLNQAANIYRQYRINFLTMGALIYTPVIVIMIILLMFSKWCVIFCLPLILLANRVNTAFCSLAVNDLLNRQSKYLKPRLLLIPLLRNIFPLVLTSLISGLKVLTDLGKFKFAVLQNYSTQLLFAPIVVLEGKYQNSALAYSTNLSKRISTITANLLFYEMALAVMTIVMTQILMWWFYWSNGGTVSMLLSQGIGLIFTLAPIYCCPLILSIGHSIYGIANTLSYFKAKQINNEFPDRQYSYFDELASSITTTQSSRKIKLQYSFNLLFKASIVFTAIICIIALLAALAHNIGLPTGQFRMK